MRAVRNGPPDHEDDPFLRPSEVAAQFGVDPKTVARWARSGKLAHTRTIGGHIRIKQSTVNEWIAATGSDSDTRPEGATHD